MSVHSSARRAHIAGLLSGAAAAAMIATTAGAQTAPAAIADKVGEIVVTARHRQESLQKVPVAVSVVNGALAASRNLNDLQDISSNVPTVDFRNGASNKDRTLFIRGLGTITTSPGVEPSVSTVVDGVVLARPGQATADLLDLDHIEVLRGPQGTLFGKNASAGVINIVTKTPTDAFRAYAEGAYYEGDEYRVKGGVSGQILPGLDGQIAVVTSGYAGNVFNRATDERVNGYRHDGGRAKLVATPTDTLTLTFSADYMHSVDTVPTGVWQSATRQNYKAAPATSAPIAASLAAAGITPSLDNASISTNLNSSVHDNNGGLSLQADWKLGPDTLTSITAYRRWDNKQIQDYDQLSAISTGVPQVADHGDVKFWQFSQELRITSPKGGFFDYVAGLYYMHAADKEVYRRDATALTGGVLVSNDGVAQYGTTGDNYAIYGEGDINFTKSFRAIIGVRGILDDLSYNHERTSTAAATGIQPTIGLHDGSVQKTGYGDRMGLQYDINPSADVYFTYSHGYKGPAYNVFFNFLAPRDTIALNPETSNSYEIGLKGSALDHRVQASLAAYITDFDNYQANFTDTAGGALVTRLINAGTVSSKGIEGDLSAHPIHDLSLSFSFARTDAKVDHFNCPANAPSSCDIDGKVLPFAPKWKLDADARYLIRASDAINLEVATDYGWQSATQYSLAETPDTIQPAYGVWNASAALLGTKGDWSVRLLVKNILDQHYSPYIAYGDLGGVVHWVPRDDHRYFGVIVHKDF